MNIARMFGAAIVRKCAYIIAAFLVYGLLSLFGIKAYAATGPITKDACNSPGWQCTIEEAAQACQLMIDASPKDGNPVPDYQCEHVPAQSKFRLMVYHHSPGGCGEAGCGIQDYHYTVGCPVGAEWNAATGECRDETYCQNLNTGINNQGPVPRTWTSFCPASGCALTMDPGYSTSTTNGQTIYRGELTYTGDSCTPGTDPPNDDDATDNKRNECVPAGAGQTYCKKPDGHDCYTSTAGRQICWREGETGEKTDGPVIQVRKAGDEPPTEPSKPPPPGEEYVPGPTSTTTTTTNNTTINTAIGNFGTVNGTDAGDTDQGENTDGTGVPGEDGEEDGTAGGGEGCESPPVFTGDQLLGNILLQVWRNRCKPNGNKTADSGCGEDGGVLGFSCSGDEILCKTRLVTLEAKCLAARNDGRMAHDAELFDPFAEEVGPSIFTDQGEGPSLNGNLVQASGGVLFPDVEIEGQHWSPPPELFDVIDLVRAILIGAFTLLAMLIAGGSRET